MRLLLVALALLVALPASAQSRFVSTCVASATGDEAVPFDPGQVCQCAADAAVMRGVPGGDLDTLMDFVGEDGEFDAARMTPEAEATAALASETLMACAISSMASSTANAAALEVPNPKAQTAVRATEAPAVAAPASRALPPGIQTGNGTDPVRTQQHGRGAVIRITG